MRYHNIENREEILLDTDVLFPKLSRSQLVALRAEVKIALMMRDI